MPRAWRPSSPGYAWRSLGATEFDSIERIEHRAYGCAWFTFSADTDWFEQIAWDLGVVTLTPPSSCSPRRTPTDPHESARRAGEIRLRRNAVGGEPGCCAR
ncbi:DUF6183 family protein [Nocardia neocaledoniensis]|uniref:DUF6183 family protein n=1 Tax=Nocardia neocaledoniensis TaxID=236511 RepID=UPI003D794BF2